MLAATRLHHFMDKAQEIRRSSVEGGRVRSVVIITDDSDISAEIERGDVSGNYPSWTLKTIFVHPLDPQVEQLMDATIVAQRASHLVGSLGSSFFKFSLALNLGHQVGCYQSWVSENERASSCTDQSADPWTLMAGFKRFWNVDTPIFSGPSGFYGANLPSVTSALNARVSHISELRKLSNVPDDSDPSDMVADLQQTSDLRAKTCRGNNASLNTDGDCVVDIKKVNSCFLFLNRWLRLFIGTFAGHGIFSFTAYSAPFSNSGHGWGHLRFGLEGSNTPPAVPSSQLSQVMSDGDLGCLIFACLKCVRIRSRAARFPNHGAAASINYLIIQLKRGFRDNRPVVFEGICIINSYCRICDLPHPVLFSGQWIYAGCPARDFTCILEPSTSCTTTPNISRSLKNKEHRFGYGQEATFEGLGSAYPYRLEEIDPEYVPPVYELVVSEHRL